MADIALGKMAVVDMTYGGTYRVRGVVSVNGVPAARRVRLFDQISGRIVRETWSDETTGAYSFDWIRDGEWIVLVHDHTGTYDPEAKADIQSELMP